jgi:DNA (cytosine-5)-methyltransferase 1
MTHGSLFSGIDGFGLGLRWAGIRTLWQVENDPCCLPRLRKNFPRAKRHSDVRECGRHNLEKVDIISAGFPCQDLSRAGLQRGLDGKQSILFFEAARIIGRELRPPWAILENVPEALTKYGDRILGKMEAMDYQCWPILLGAREVGATHKRTRAWILCHRADARCDHPAVEGLGALPKKAEKALAEAIQRWNERAEELASGDCKVEGDAYARIARDRDGLSTWMDRHHALGNAVVPVIPMLLGCFIKTMEEAR